MIVANPNILRIANLNMLNYHNIVSLLGYYDIKYVRCSNDIMKNTTCVNDLYEGRLFKSFNLMLTAGMCVIVTVVTFVRLAMTCKKSDTS